jgi:hypothetical protein
MAPDRFDDVDIRFMEDEPEPPRRAPSLRRRMTVALSAWILAAGVLAAGASALTDSSDGAAAAKAGAAESARSADGVFSKRDGHKCDRERYRGGSSSSSSSFSPSDF